jgi:hypothetical protein
MPKIADAALVHGAGFKIGPEGLAVPTPTTLLRVDFAARVIENSGTDIVVVCGRSANDSDSCAKSITEAAVMASLLQDNYGIPEEMILIEDESVSTLGNLALGISKLQEEGCESFCGITSSLHLPRALASAEYVAPKSTVALIGYESVPEAFRLSSCARELAQRAMLVGFMRTHEKTPLEKIADSYEDYKNHIPVVSKVKELRYKTS